MPKLPDRYDMDKIDYDPGVSRSSAGGGSGGSGRGGGGLGALAKALGDIGAEDQADQYAVAKANALSELQTLETKTAMEYVDAAASMPVAGAGFLDSWDKTKKREFNDYYNKHAPNLRSQDARALHKATIDVEDKWRIKAHTDATAQRLLYNQTELQDQLTERQNAVALNPDDYERHKADGETMIQGWDLPKTQREIMRRQYQRTLADTAHKAEVARRALGPGASPEQIQEYMERDLRGSITPRQPRKGYQRRFDALEGAANEESGPGLPVGGPRWANKTIDDVPEEGGSPKSRGFGFNVRKDKEGKMTRHHAGIDIEDDAGAPIIATSRSKLIDQGYEEKGLGHFRTFVNLDDGKPYRVAHAGTNDNKIAPWGDGLKKGDVVEKGQRIGNVGYSGNAGSDFPHVHYEVFKDEKSYRERGLKPSVANMDIRLDPFAYHGRGKGGGKRSDDPVSNFMRVSQLIESGGNDKSQRAGSSYAGRHQLSDEEWEKYGGKGDRHNGPENERVARLRYADLFKEFEKKHGRTPDDYELYLTHQQGQAGYAAHAKNPDGVAWQNVRPYYTDEAARKKGFKNGDEYAQAAIWKNLTPEAQAEFGSVDKVTSGQFTEFWNNRFDKKAAEAGVLRKESPRSMFAEVRERGGSVTDVTPQAEGQAVEGEAEAKRMLAQANSDPSAMGSYMPTGVPLRPGQGRGIAVNGRQLSSEEFLQRVIEESDGGLIEGGAGRFGADLHITKQVANWKHVLAERNKIANGLNAEIKEAEPLAAAGVALPKAIRDDLRQRVEQFGDRAMQARLNSMLFMAHANNNYTKLSPEDRLAHDNAMMQAVTDPVTGMREMTPEQFKLFNDRKAATKASDASLTKNQIDWSMEYGVMPYLVGKGELPETHGQVDAIVPGDAASYQKRADQGEALGRHTKRGFTHFFRENEAAQAGLNMRRGGKYMLQQAGEITKNLTYDQAAVAFKQIAPTDPEMAYVGGYFNVAMSVNSPSMKKAAENMAHALELRNKNKLAGKPALTIKDPPGAIDDVANEVLGATFSTADKTYRDAGLAAARLDYEAKMHAKGKNEYDAEEWRASVKLAFGENKDAQNRIRGGVIQPPGNAVPYQVHPGVIKEHGPELFEYIVTRLPRDSAYAVGSVPPGTPLLDAKTRLTGAPLSGDLPTAPISDTGPLPEGSGEKPWPGAGEMVMSPNDPYLPRPAQSARAAEKDGNLPIVIGMGPKGEFVPRPMTRGEFAKAHKVSTGKVGEYYLSFNDPRSDDAAFVFNNSGQRFTFQVEDYFFHVARDRPYILGLEKAKPALPVPYGGPPLKQGVAYPFGDPDAAAAVGDSVGGRKWRPNSDFSSTNVQDERGYQMPVRDPIPEMRRMNKNAPEIKNGRIQDRLPQPKEPRSIPDPDDRR